MTEINSPEARAARLKLNQDRAEQLKSVLKGGEALMVTRCMGTVAEYVFSNQWDGLWLCGYSTYDTDRILNPERLRPRGHKPGKVNDIAPMAVTHINRVPVEQALDQDCPF